MQVAADHFIDEMPQAYFTIVNFDERPVPVVEFPVLNPRRPSKDNFNNYGGETALIAATDKGISTLKNAPGLRFVILFTDGNDNASGSVGGNLAATPAQLVANAKKWNIPIYAMGVNIGNNAVLTEICESTGGKFFQINSTAEISKVFEQLQKSNFEHFYIIRAKCKETPSAFVMATPDGYFRETIEIPVDPQISDSLSLNYAVGYGNIQFDYNGVDLREQDRKYINNIAERIYGQLKDNSKLELQIQGYASTEGKDEYNLWLSKQRAEHVKNYLVSAIEKKYGPQIAITSRITSDGFGETNQLFPPNSLRNDENRRVEIRAIKMKKY